MFQKASMLALLALNFLPMSGLDAKAVEKSQPTQVKEKEQVKKQPIPPFKGQVQTNAFTLAEFAGNFIFLLDSTGGVSNQNVSQFDYGQSTGAVAQVSFGESGSGTANFMSFTAFSGALSTAYTSNSGASGYASTTCPPLPFPGSQNILPVAAEFGPNCNVISPTPITFNLTLTQPAFGSGYAVLTNMPYAGAVTYFDFVASKGGSSQVQTIYFNMTQTNIDVNNVIIQGNFSPYPFGTITSQMIRQ